MKKNKLFSLSCILVFLLSGCSTMPGPETSLFGDGRVTPASANQMFDESFEGFNNDTLIQLIDPIRLGGSVEDGTNTKSGSNVDKQFRNAFYNANNHDGYKDKTAHRAQIQDRLIAASNQRCNLYTTHIKRLSSKTNGILGTLTTALGGAGAIVTGAEAARILAGLAGIASGTRAEINQAIFESVATSVIVPAIQIRREKILEEIRKKRSGDTALSMQEYTIEGAVADAIIYHGACSMDAGIAEAQQSIHAFDNNLGLIEALRTQDQVLGSAHLASIIFSETKLKEFNGKLVKYKEEVSTIDSSKKDQKELSTKLDKLITSSSKDGDLFKEAEKLDADLKAKLDGYHADKGNNVSEQLVLLSLQQAKAIEFNKKLNADNNEIKSRLNKLKSLDNEE